MDNRTPDSNRNDQPNQEGGSPFQNPGTQRMWLIVGGAVILLFVWLLMTNGGGPQGTPTTFNDMAEDIRRGNVARVTVYGSTDIIIEYNDGRPNGAAYKSAETDLFERLASYGVTDVSTFQYAERPGNDSGGILLQIAIAIVPTLLIVWLLWRMMRSVRFGQDQAMSFGRSRPRVMRDMERPQVTFADVAGAEEAKEELKEIVEFLKEPEKFIRLGARVPKGVLMIGPPGTGKTLMARAVAGEAGVPFFSISGSEFVEMFVGVGASRVRDLFDRSKAEAPSIIFVDEIDAVGRHRGAGLGGGHDEREQTLNQILVEMDGFDTDTNVIIIAATNRPDILDPALLRPGRFDRKVTMDSPDIKGRLDILKVHAKGKPLSADVDLEAIARITVGFSGADLENLINEAAILAARRNKKAIAMSEMQESMERVAIGPERRSRVMTEKSKNTTAYHEAGHAVVHYFLDHAPPVHKITIIPRGKAGGYTMSLPEEDNFGYTREQFEDMITTFMGGRAAEEIVLNQFSTGAGNDLQRSTQLAHQMVTQFGMSEKLGPRTFGSGHNQIFLGREIAEQRDYSDHYAEEIDNEVKRLLTTAYQRAKNILIEHRDKLDTVARALLDFETIDSEMFNQIMDGSYNPMSNGRTNRA